MCGGGGGDGGAEAARRAEADNLAAYNQSYRDIQAAYGYGFGGDNNADLLATYGLDAEGNFQGWGDDIIYEGTRGNPYNMDIGAPSRDDFMVYDDYAEDSVFDNEAYAAAMDEYNTRFAGAGGADFLNSLAVQAGDLSYGGVDSKYDDLDYTFDPAVASEAYKNYLAREKRYADNKTDIMAHFMDDPETGIQRQHTDAYNNILADLARRGMTGGSTGADIRSKLQTRLGSTTADYTGKADNLVNEIKASDQDLVDLALSRVSDVGTKGMSIDEMNIRAGESAKTKFNDLQAQQMTGLFRDLEELYNLQQTSTGTQEAIDSYQNGYKVGAAPSANSGSIY